MDKEQIRSRAHDAEAGAGGKGSSQLRAESLTVGCSPCRTDAFCLLLLA